MTFDLFERSLEDGQPPTLSHPLLTALWHEGKGDWGRAHDIAQDIDSREGAWVHAHLHRVEGDIWNANYWYRRAGRSMPELSVKEEWKALVEHLLREPPQRKS